MFTTRRSAAAAAVNHPGNGSDYASPGQEVAGGVARGLWTVATEGVNTAALFTENWVLVWAVLSKILKIACQ